MDWVMEAFTSVDDGDEANLLIALKKANQAEVIVRRDHVHDRTLLHAICMDSIISVEPVDILLSWGASIAAFDSEGKTALHCASGAGHPLKVAALLMAGADPNMSDGFGCSPLHEAVMHFGNLTVPILLEAGADPHLINNEGQTPLMTACLNCNEEAVKLLLPCSNLEMTDFKGKSVFDHARDGGDGDIIGLLDAIRKSMWEKNDFNNIAHLGKCRKKSRCL